MSRRLIGKSFKMQEIYEIINTISLSDATILITGETGTGKNVLAQVIHANSQRCDKRFVTVDCNTFSESLLESELFGHEKGAFTNALNRRIGRFEYANEGTIFLDEIGDLSPIFQLKLLRVIQERSFERMGSNETVKVDVRIITATNKDLKEEVRKGRFREDLYYRLNVIPIHLPPLRERIDDIPLLSNYYLNIYSKLHNKDIRGFSQDVINAMMRYRWPGNVRELENVIERAVIMQKGDIIENLELSLYTIDEDNDYNTSKININSTPIEESKEDISHGLIAHFCSINNADYTISFSEMKRMLISEFEYEYIINILKEFKGNISKSAKRAKMDYKTFYEKMRKYNISKATIAT